MTIASMLLALVVTAAADNSGTEPVLYDFHASWCGPCRTMRPEVDKLARKNYPIKSVDIDQSPDIAERFGVKAVPAFLVVDPQGRVLARTQGVLPAPELAAFYNDATTKYQGTARREVRTASAEVDDPAAEAAEAQPDGEPEAANPLPWQTVVRIKMHLSRDQVGLGSGTIIYSDSEQSIILTCAHIFRDVHGQSTPLSKFNTRISVDLFDGQTPKSAQHQLRCIEAGIAGEAIDYDFVNDVGLIRIRPGRRLPASRVVPTSWQPRPGLPMYSVGCSHGQDATARDTKILEPRVKMVSGKNSFYEMKCTTQPEEGRSGGGLYTRDGFVAGVCDFADPQAHVGLYAVPTAIHKLLDRNQMTALYQAPSDGPSRMLASAERGGTRARLQNDDEPAPAAGFTLPSPDRLGIKAPGTKVASATSRPSPWANPTLDGASSKSRTARRPERASGESFDPGPRAGAALATELSRTANSEDLLEMPDPEAGERRAVPDPAAGGTKWRGVRSTRPIPRD